MQEKFEQTNKTIMQSFVIQTHQVNCIATFMQNCCHQLSSKNHWKLLLERCTTLQKQLLIKDAFIINIYCDFCDVSEIRLLNDCLLQLKPMFYN